MSSAEYQFGTHRSVPNLLPQLVRLSNAAFAQYEGAMPVDEVFMSWYLQRPGCRPELCVAATRDGTLVSNVLVAIQQLQIGGDLLPCGIVDTVATDPQHQRRGLARRLMEDAHRLMQEAGAEAAVLYTNPDDHPYRFYQRLGYHTVAHGEALMGHRPAPVPGPRPRSMTTEDTLALWALLDRYHAHYDGYAPMSRAQWEWHRVNRPASMPAEVLVLAGEAGTVTATAAFAEADLYVGGETARASVLSDFASVGDEADHLSALLQEASCQRILAFVDTRSPVHAYLSDLGFSGAVREVAMVLPFSDRARGAVSQMRGPWYFMIESLVGV